MAGWFRASRITSVITEPEPAIIHFKTTRKSGFACIALLSGQLELGVKLQEERFVNIVRLFRDQAKFKRFK